MLLKSTKNRLTNVAQINPQALLKSTQINPQTLLKLIQSTTFTHNRPTNVT